MHKALGKMIEKEVGKGEKEAPLKSVKLKVKFQKKDDDKYESKKKELAKNKK